MTYQFVLRDADGADLVVSDPVFLGSGGDPSQLLSLSKIIFSQIQQECGGLTGTTLVVTIDLRDPVPELEPES